MKTSDFTDLFTACVHEVSSTSKSKMGNDPRPSVCCLAPSPIAYKRLSTLFHQSADTQYKSRDIFLHHSCSSRSHRRRDTSTPGVIILRSCRLNDFNLQPISFPPVQANGNPNLNPTTAIINSIKFPLIISSSILIWLLSRIPQS